MQIKWEKIEMRKNFICNNLRRIIENFILYFWLFCEITIKNYENEIVKKLFSIQPQVGIKLTKRKLKMKTDGLWKIAFRSLENLIKGFSFKNKTIKSPLKVVECTPEGKFFWLWLLVFSVFYFFILYKPACCNFLL